MNKPIKIAHLTDLHCDATSHWENLFNIILNSIENDIKPNIIVITGDLLNNPLPKCYTMLSEAIKKLKKCCGGKIDIVVVPGNHDIAYFGNFYFWGRRQKFNKFIENELYSNESVKNVIGNIFRKTNIAIFPLDSTCYKKWFFILAQGQIDSPSTALSEFSLFFKKIARDNNISYENSLKIAIMHHHALPSGSRPKDDKLEPFLLMRNSYQVIDAIISHDIDIILHGHKHSSSTAEYTQINISENKTIFVISCANTGKYNEKEKEFKIIEKKPSGAITIKSAISRESKNSFMLEQSSFFDLISYEEIRKRRNILENNSDSNVDHIYHRTKIVNILENGDAEISLSLEGITWKDNLTFKPRIIRETIRSDIGRISAGQYEFGSCPLIDPTFVKTWLNPIYDNNIPPQPTEPDEFDIFIQSQNPVQKTERCCKIGYLLANGYALTDTEHKLLYDWSDAELEREEVCSIETLYPTNSLELIVAFPENDSNDFEGASFFPNPHSFYLIAYKKSPTHHPPTLDILKNKYEIDTEETMHLFKNNAIRVREERNEVSVLIKYPQPNLVYTLRWQVPDSDIYVNLSPREDEILQRLRKEFHCSTRKERNKFYVNVCNEIRKTLKDDNLLFFLLGYNSKEKVLEVVNHPDEYPPLNKLCVGRGAAGKAFRLGEVTYWSKYRYSSEEERLLFSYPVERVIKNLDASAVISIPLLFPLRGNYTVPDKTRIQNNQKVEQSEHGALNHKKSNDSTAHGESDNSVRIDHDDLDLFSDVRYHSFGVFSVVATNRQHPFVELDRLDEGELEELFSLIAGYFLSVLENELVLQFNEIITK